jgi:hypothetical protein
VPAAMLPKGQFGPLVSRVATSASERTSDPMACGAICSGWVWGTPPRRHGKALFVLGVPM